MRNSFSRTKEKDKKEKKKETGKRRSGMEENFINRKQDGDE